jgi:hypothetical protein
VPAVRGQGEEPMTARKTPTLKEKLAAFVLTMKIEEDGKLVPLVTREEAKQMTTDQILSLVQADHDPVPVAIAVPLGWTPEQYNHPTNLTMRAIIGHRIKTATKDVPQIAKSNRLSAQHQDFQRRMLRRTGQAEGEEEKPKRKALINGSRGTPFRKKINGQVVRRSGE